MASTAQQQVAGILGETFANTKILVMFTIFALANLVGFSIKDFNLKICYWLSLTLVMVSLVNFNMAISFYISLRNEKGVEGPRGRKGDPGPKGFPGRCELNLEATCGIRNCRTKIQEKLLDHCPNYKDIVNKRDVDRSVEEQNMLRKYDAWMKIIEDQCNDGNRLSTDEDEFFNLVFQDNERYCLV